MSAVNPIHGDGSIVAGISRLRRIGWSDRSIARHLNVPLDAVQHVLGIKVYDTHGNAVPPRNVIVALEAAE